MLIDYAYYAGYHEKENIPVPASEFQRLARDAQAFFDAVTFRRVNGQNVTDQIKDTLCMLVDEAYSYEKQYAGASQERAKISETVGKHTVSYAQTPDAVKSLDQRRYKIVKRMLFDTGLLYKGVR